MAGISPDSQLPTAAQTVCTKRPLVCLSSATETKFKGKPRTQFVSSVRSIKLLTIFSHPTSVVHFYY